MKLSGNDRELFQGRVAGSALADEVKTYVMNRVDSLFAKWPDGYVEVEADEHGDDERGYSLNVVVRSLQRHP